MMMVVVGAAAAVAAEDEVEPARSAFVSLLREALIRHTQ